MKRLQLAPSRDGPQVQSESGIEDASLKWGPIFKIYHQEKMIAIGTKRMIQNKITERYVFCNQVYWITS